MASVAVAAFPVVSWSPVAFTPGKSIFEVPSNDTPPIFLAFWSAVAVEALPFIFPVTLPVILAITVPATKFSLPRVHLPFVSSHKNVLAPKLPRFTCNPTSKLGVPDKAEFKVIILSEISTVVELIVVVVPSTIKSPFITTVPLTSPPAG